MESTTKYIPPALRSHYHTVQYRPPARPSNTVTTSQFSSILSTQARGAPQLVSVPETKSPVEDKEEQPALSDSEAEAFFKQAYADLICSCCFDVFVKPVTLQCGHTFCHECLTKWYSTSSADHHKKTCPMRDAPLSCPSTWRINVALRYIIDLLQSEAKIQTAQISLRAQRAQLAVRTEEVEARAVQLTERENQVKEREDVTAREEVRLQLAHVHQREEVASLVSARVREELEVRTALVIAETRRERDALAKEREEWMQQRQRECDEAKRLEHELKLREAAISQREQALKEQEEALSKQSKQLRWQKKLLRDSVLNSDSKKADTAEAKALAADSSAQPNDEESSLDELESPQAAGDETDLDLGVSVPSLTSYLQRSGANISAPKPLPTLLARSRVARRGDRYSAASFAPRVVSHLPALRAEENHEPTKPSVPLTWAGRLKSGRKGLGLADEDIGLA